MIVHFVDVPFLEITACSSVVHWLLRIHRVLGVVNERLVAARVIQGVDGMLWDALRVHWLVLVRKLIEGVILRTEEGSGRNGARWQRNWEGIREIGGAVHAKGGIGEGRGVGMAVIRFLNGWKVAVRSGLHGLLVDDWFVKICLLHIHGHGIGPWRGSGGIWMSVVVVLRNRLMFLHVLLIVLNFICENL